MSVDNRNMNEIQTKKPGQKFTVLMLITVFALPFVGAWVIYSFTEYGSDGVNNSHGRLIMPPGQVSDIQLTAPLADGSQQTLHGKWSLVYIASASCASDCEHALEIMRGTRAVLGNEAYRLQLILVIDTPNLTDSVKSMLREKRISTLDSISIEGIENREDLGGGSMLVQDNLFIIDPLGNLMMLYSEQSTLAGVIKDIKRLLRNSRIG